MSDIEDDAALASFPHRGIHVPGFVLFISQSGVTVCINVARPKFLSHQLAHGTLRAVGSKIHHHRNIGDGSRFHRPLYWSPFGARVVRRFYAYDPSLVA